MPLVFGAGTAVLPASAAQQSKIKSKKYNKTYTVLSTYRSKRAADTYRVVQRLHMGKRPGAGQKLTYCSETYSKNYKAGRPQIGAVYSFVQPVSVV
jgi:hypothetical protein